MVDLTLFFGSVLLMAGSSHWFFKALTTNVTIESMASGNSRRASRLGQQYKITAWGLLTGLLLAQTLYYFTLVFLRF
jgi:hypothetical protein